MVFLWCEVTAAMPEGFWIICYNNKPGYGAVVVFDVREWFELGVPVITLNGSRIPEILTVNNLEGDLI
jgi:hypothetical protein